jgi:tetratricopeptide (TPR) repeat protein
VVGLVLALLLAGCAVTLPSGDIVEIPVEEWVPGTSEVDASAKAETDAVPEYELAEPEPEPEPVVFSLLPLSEGEPLRAQDIFARVSPAVAHIDTPDGTGSALLVEHGYLVSAAHVVWPYESVRAVFPNGTEFKELPVAAWDLMTDVALLGPVETEIEPLLFVDGTDLPIGSEVYLIGYPAEFEEFPQPALGRGLISRLREWDTTGVSMFQVDADISSGQSGGVLISALGDLVGITSYSFTDSDSPMATSSADVVTALTSMLMGEPQPLANRRPMEGEATLTHEGVLEDDLAFAYFLLYAEAGDEIELNVKGVGNPIVSIVSVRGYFFESSTPRAAQMSVVKTTVYYRGPYMVEVSQPSKNRNPYALTSSHPLYAIEDPDDGTRLKVGDTYAGSIDNPYDSDEFTIELRAGNRVSVQAESLMVDPLVYISFESRSCDFEVYDDDSGPAGLFGLNARVVFVAPEDGEYSISISDSAGEAVGGYILNVSKGMRSTPLTDTVFEEQHYLTSRGMFDRYMSAGFPFAVLYPAHYTADWYCEDATACFAGSTDYLVITEASSSELAPSERDLDLILDTLKTGLGLGLGEITVLSRQTLRTQQGLDAKMESMTANYENAYIASFAFFDEGIGLFIGIYVSQLRADANLAAMDDFAEFLFSTFRVYNADSLADDPAYHLEEGMVQAAKGYYRPALADLKFALLLNEEMVEAYKLRARIHSNMGNHDLSLADLEAALELEPDDATLILSQAHQFWYQGDYGQALTRSEDGIELRPDYQGTYNNRALYQAAAGDYEGALQELAKYEEMVEDGLPPNALDTRAYVHLKFDTLDEALVDYEEALADDFQHPVTLLGAGVTLARLDRVDEALPLLERGMELYDDAEYEVINPQLTEVLAWANEIMNAK